jgi:hypothetical protein
VAETTTTDTNGEAPPAPPAADPPADKAPTAEDVRALTDALANERKRREQTQGELDELRKAAMSDNEKAIAEAKAAGRAEAMTEVNARLLAAEVRAVAADRLADASDAVRLLDLDDLANTDGTPNEKAIVAALDKLVEAKPYLAKAVPAAGGGPPASRPPQGARDGGQAEAPDDFIRRSVRGS